jgi:hypothetical protein
MTGSNGGGPMAADRPDLPAELRLLAAELTPADRRRVPPPPEVWQGIVAALDLDLSAAESGPETGTYRDRRRPRADVTDIDPPRSFTDTVELRSAMQQTPELPPVGRNPARTWVPAAAAVLIAIAGAIITFAVNDEAEERLVAAGTLSNEGLAVDSDQSATVRLIEVDGVVELEVSVAEFEAESERADGYLELWLVDPDIDRVVSLGPLTPGQRYRVPEDLSFDDYPVVDVSVELLDGDPGHSGRSIWRGPLEPTVDGGDD